MGQRGLLPVPRKDDGHGITTQERAPGSPVGVCSLEHPRISLPAITAETGYTAGTGVHG